MLDFFLLLGLSQVVLVVIVVLVGYWTYGLLGGYKWDGSFGEFNLHPLFMCVGLVCMYGDAILMFRVFRRSERRVLKLVHAAMHTLALIFGCLGLKTVFNFHLVQGFPDMYSFHSWVGLTAFILFTLQWFAGIFSFLYPRLNDELRASYARLHRYIGLATFALVIAAAFAGINEKLFFVHSGKGDSAPYSALPHGALIGNFLGFNILVFGLIVGYLATYHDPRSHPAKNTDVPLQEGFDNQAVE